MRISKDLLGHQGNTTILAEDSAKKSTYLFGGSVAECTLAPEVRSQNTSYEINRAYGLIRLPRRYFFLSALIASRLVDAASPRTITIDKKKISSGIQGRQSGERIGLVIRLFGFKICFDYKRSLFLIILSSFSRSCSCK